MGCVCSSEQGPVCLSCSRHSRESAPNLTEPKFKKGMACRHCVSQMKGDELMMLEHKLGNHGGCAESFPESELQYESPAYYDQRKAEWKHSHGTHDLCRPEYYLGCTDEEKAEIKEFEAKSRPHDPNARPKTVTTAKATPASNEAV